VPIQSIKGYQFSILGISFAPDQLTIASGNIEEGLKFWDAQSGENTFSLDQSRRAIDEIYISSDGAWIATSHADRTVRVWDVNSSKEVYTFDGYLPKGLPLSPDNTFLAYVFSPGQNKDSVIRVIKLATGEQVAELTGYIQKTFVQFREDSNLLVIGDAYKATLWDVATWEQVDTIGGPTLGAVNTTHRKATY
jgi:WD40 repeat protein